MGRWVRPLAGVAVLACALAATRPDVQAWSTGISPITLCAALLGTAVTTLAAAARWCATARAAGVVIGFRSAVESCYRSQLLNCVLPGGVPGDVHRSLVHGRETGDRGAVIRSVLVERGVGQVVQVLLTLAVLLVAAGSHLAVTVVLIGGVGLWLLVRPLRLVEGRDWPTVLATSAVVVLGHAAVFVVVARAAGVDAPLAVLFPVVLVTLAGAAVPVGIAGWGPREGAAAWAFTQAGLGAGTGLAVSAAYGVVALIATLPGLVPLLRQHRHRHRPLVARG